MAASVTAGKKKGLTALVVAAIVCVCVAVAAIPAHAFWYVHSEENVADTSGKGVMEVSCTLDMTAKGGGVWTDLIFVPSGSTVADCLQEFIMTEEDHKDPDAIHDYSYKALSDYLGNTKYDVAVYKAGSQEPGTHTTFDSNAQTGTDTALERYDCVVFTAQK